MLKEDESFVLSILSGGRTWRVKVEEDEKAWRRYSRDGNVMNPGMDKVRRRMRIRWKQYVTRFIILVNSEEIRWQKRDRKRGILRNQDEKNPNVRYRWLLIITRSGNCGIKESKSFCIYTRPYIKNAYLYLLIHEILISSKETNQIIHSIILYYKIICNIKSVCSDYVIYLQSRW